MLYSVHNFLSIIWILFKPLAWLFKRLLFREVQINEFDVEDHYLRHEMRRRHPPEGFQSLIVEDPTERDQHRNMSGRSDEVTKTSYRPAYNYHHVIGFRNWPICIVRRREPPGAVLTERYTCVWTLGKRSTLLIDFIEDCGPSYRQSRGQLIEVYRPQNKPYRASRSPWRTDIPSASLRLEHAYGDRKTCGTLVEDVRARRVQAPRIPVTRRSGNWEDDQCVGHCYRNTGTLVSYQPSGFFDDRSRAS